MPKKSLYIPDTIDQIVSSGEADSYSGRVSYLVTLARDLAFAEVPALTVGEWCAIADANNGTLHTYEHGPATVFRGAWHSVYDSAPECDEKWGVNCEALAKRLAALPLAAQAAVFEIARSFWARGDVVSAAGSYRDAFIALGAKIAE